MSIAKNIFEKFLPEGGYYYSVVSYKNGVKDATWLHGAREKVKAEGMADSIRRQHKGEKGFVVKVVPVYVPNKTDESYDLHRRINRRSPGNFKKASPEMKKALAAYDKAVAMKNQKKGCSEAHTQQELEFKSRYHSAQGKMLKSVANWHGSDSKKLKRRAELHAKAGEAAKRLRKEDVNEDKWTVRYRDAKTKKYTDRDVEASSREDASNKATSGFAGKVTVTAVQPSSKSKSWAQPAETERSKAYKARQQQNRNTMDKEHLEKWKTSDRYKNWMKKKAAGFKAESYDINEIKRVIRTKGGLTTVGYANKNQALAGLDAERRGIVKKHNLVLRDQLKAETDPKKRKKIEQQIKDTDWVNEG